MKYIKYYEAYTPFGNYLIKDNVKSEEKVKNFVEYFKLSNSVLNIWKGMVQRYNEYPLEITPNHILYSTKDGGTIKINLIEDKIVSMEKFKVEHIGGQFNKKVVFSGKYKWIDFEKLYLG